MRFNTVAELIESNTWKPGHGASGFDSASNYSGEDLSEWISVIGRNRDSDVLTESNFQCALERLGGESKSVMVAHMGHWACGWFELILVKNTAKKKLEIAREILNAIESYPVLDESDYSEREHESYSEWAQQAKESTAQAIANHLGIKVTPKLIEVAYDLEMEAQFNGGPDSALGLNEYHPLDQGDIQRTVRLLESVAGNGNDSKLPKRLLKLFAQKGAVIK